MEEIKKSLFKKYNRSFINFSLLKHKSGLEDLMKYRELKKIIKTDALTTFFQPIKELKEGEIVGYEVLNRPPISNQFKSTEQFYDFIGGTNLVHLFEIYCRTTSIKKFASNINKWNNQKEKLLFINIQPEVLIDSQYKPGETLHLLEEFNLKPEQIVFELTEKKAVSDFDMFERVIFNYRSQGFRLAVDDAGSGYNSLKTLVHLKPEFIKLDRSLIHNIVQNDAQQKMVSLLLEYANQIDTYVIAEGIEQIVDLEYLKIHGIHLGQGYALGKPNKNIEAS